jgi:NodT family efflux transporter outer membrane factor (OMF) lipoprotein
MKHALVILATLSLLGGCTTGPRYNRPTAATEPQFKEAPPQSWRQAAPNAAIPRGKWWEIYNDPVLNGLEEQVSISNQNVLAAMAQYDEARAAIRVARSAYYPTVTASASVTNTRNSTTVSRTNPNAVSSGTHTQYDLPVDVSYQADVFGSIRHSVRASRALAQASDADLENVRLTFQAQLAQSYFGLRGADTDAQLLANTVKIYEQYLQLAKARLEVGVASGADVAQAQTQLAQAKAQLIDIGVSRAQFEHAIAIMVGKPPAEVSVARTIYAANPPQVPTGVSSTLLERRPDIAGAERRVAAQNEQIGVATSAFFPQILISATGGLQSTSPTDWFTWPSRFWSVGPQIAQTIFDGGKRKAQVALERATYQASVAQYRQTVLTAFQQVEDQLSTLRILEEEAKAQTEAVQASQSALDIATEQYKAGTADYLAVIVVQAAALQNQRTAIDISTRRMTSSVLLVEALGGGWDETQLAAK